VSKNTRKSPSSNVQRLSNREIGEFLELMRSVDTKCELARLNETTLLDRSDDKGRRIKY